MVQVSLTSSEYPNVWGGSIRFLLSKPEFQMSAFSRVGPEHAENINEGR